MGRYDGEYYEEQVPCRGNAHDWAMNGTCWKCGHTRKALIANAKALLEKEGYAIPQRETT